MGAPVLVQPSFNVSFVPTDTIQQMSLMGRQRQSARQRTGHWAAIVPAARAVAPTQRMNGRFLPKRPAVPHVIERRVTANADIAIEIWLSADSLLRVLAGG